MSSLISFYDALRPLLLHGLFLGKYLPISFNKLSHLLNAGVKEYFSNIQFLLFCEKRKLVRCNARSFISHGLYRQPFQVCLCLNSIVKCTLVKLFPKGTYIQIPIQLILYTSKYTGCQLKVLVCHSFQDFSKSNCIMRKTTMKQV